MLLIISAETPTVCFQLEIRGNINANCRKNSLHLILKIAVKKKPDIIIQVHTFKKIASSKI